LIKQKNTYLSSFFDHEIPSENNASERAVRNLKVKQKVSGMFKSETGADTYRQIHFITQFQEE